MPMKTTAIASVVTSGLTNITLTRPTEGQLKWALLHHRRVALTVQSYVRRLYLYPESAQDVPGYYNVDDVNDDDVYLNEKENTNRPTIRLSEGRRAMLRVSQLAYEQRKRQIVDHGFKFHRLCSDSESDDSSCCSSESCEKVFPSPKGLGFPYDVIDDNNSICAKTQSRICYGNNSHVNTTGRRKRFRQRRRKFQPRCSDPERVRRFKEAFQAAMRSLEVAADTASKSQQKTSPDKSTSPFLTKISPDLIRRKWTRPDAEATSFQDEAYTVWGCSKVLKRQPAVHNPTLTPGKAPLDRGATWLQLLHGGHNTKNNTPRGYSVAQPRTPDVTCSNTKSQTTIYRKRSILTPALRRHVADVAREIFSGDRNVTHASTENRDTRSRCLLDTLEHDVSSFVEQFEQHIASNMVGAAAILDSHNISFEKSSPRHPTSSIDCSAIATTPKSCGIAPVVTYDSDDEDNNTLLDESAISKNPFDTFIIQILDSSFVRWNETNSHGVDRKCHDDNYVVTNNSLDKCDVPSTMAVVPSTNTRAAHDSFADDILEMSPLNFKRILQMLPDKETDIRSVDSINLENLSLIKKTVVSANDVNLGHTRIIDIDTVDDTAARLFADTRKEKIDLTLNTNDEIASTRIDPDETTLSPSSENGITAIDGTLVIQQSRSCSSNQGEHTAGTRPTIPIHRNVIIPDVVVAITSSFQSSSSSSAGCGLYSERACHYDIQWEKRLRM
jgi:hypothetical protein